MLAVLVLAVFVALWASRDRGFRALRFGDVAAAVAGLAGLAMMAEGKGYGIAAIAFAGWWFWRRGRAPEIDMPAAEARALLGLPVGAEAAAVRAAHRRLIAQTHPDQGGPNELAARINAARDVLLAELNQSRPAAS